MAVREADKEDNKGNIDEIKQYRDARWVTPPEALWRIYGFDISDRSLRCCPCSSIFLTCTWCHFTSVRMFDKCLIVQVLKG
jgi:hypothetical protein